MATRILSALVGIVIGVSIIVIDNEWVYMAAIAFLSAVAVWELTRAVKCTEFKLMRWLCIAFSAYAPFVTRVEALRNWAVPVFIAFIMALFGIMLKNHERLKIEHVAMCGGAAVIVPASLSAIVMLRYAEPFCNRQEYGIFVILYVLFCAWFGDSGAYFVGTFMGKHKLCPKVSPKKTVEGLVGGIVTVGVIVALQCLIFNLLFPETVSANYIALVIIGMLASAVGVLGDLSASLIKREFDVKDFGNIMPGHGGVMDRFDSVIFVSPFLLIVFEYICPALGLNII